MTTQSVAPLAGSLKRMAEILADKEITSVLTSEYSGWKEDFIRNSFYLPVQVLKDPQYKVEPIKLVTGAEFTEDVIFALSASNGWKQVYEGCNLTMLISSRTIGVSARYIVATGEKIAVIKLWYGKNGRHEGSN